jgi:hypothetical protein
LAPTRPPPTGRATCLGPPPRGPHAPRRSDFARDRRLRRQVR